MRSADGALVLTYNGEIYNFREVKAELEKLGHAFATHSDTEVILAAWAQWGTACLERLNGMFAFALYDANAGRAVPRPRSAGREAAPLCELAGRGVDLRAPS